MSVFNDTAFDDHEQVLHCCDATSGLRAIIAVHNTALGPALGGIRMWPYGSEAEALRDVLRLSRGMTYKSAMARLPFGGGKCVLIGNPRTDKSIPLLRSLGRFVNALGGRYIGAEDSGISVADMKTIAAETRHVAGIQNKPTRNGSSRSGDPSPATAYGVFLGIQSALEYRFGTGDLAGVQVALQGVGNVGFRLAELLVGAGARLRITDIDEEVAVRTAQTLGIEAVAPDDIFDVEADVFAPCALGAIINDNTVPRLRVAIVAGSANNQLAEQRHGGELMKRKILYAPDYVINAGGVIDVSFERTGRNPKHLMRHVEGIRKTLNEIFERASLARRSTAEIADRIARERLNSGCAARHRGIRNRLGRALLPDRLPA